MNCCCVGVTDCLLQVERKDGQLRLTEETYREGVMAGSTFINTGIEHAGRERLTPAVYDAWKEKNPVDAVKLIHDRAEQQKRSFDGSAPITLDMPNSLFKVITEEVTASTPLLAAKQPCICPHRRVAGHESHQSSVFHSHACTIILHATLCHRKQQHVTINPSPSLLTRVLANPSCWASCV